MAAVYVPLPKFNTFKSKEERERILYRNFVNMGMEVKKMIKDVLTCRSLKIISVRETDSTHP